MTRDWTEAEARAWLRASLPKGWRTDAMVDSCVERAHAYAHFYAGRGEQVTCSTSRRTLRSACRALIRAAKRAGIAVNQVQEPGGKS